MMTMATGNHNNTVAAQRATKSTMMARARWATTTMMRTMATAMARCAAARRDTTMMTMATGDDDNDVNGDSAMGNERGG